MVNRVPLGIPYRAKEDTWYDGRLIPKDATVVLSIHALHQTQYPDAETYCPDRHINNQKSAQENTARPDYKNRDHYTFGAGCRTCPGINMGERTVWRMTAQLLWAFDIKPAVDAHGNTNEIDQDAYEVGFLAAPLPFEVTITPRSQKHADVVRKAASSVDVFLKQWE